MHISTAIGLGGVRHGESDGRIARIRAADTGGLANGEFEAANGSRRGGGGDANGEVDTKHAASTRGEATSYSDADAACIFPAELTWPTE